VRDRWLTDTGWQPSTSVRAVLLSHPTVRMGKFVATSTGGRRGCVMWVAMHEGPHMICKSSGEPLYDKVTGTPWGYVIFQSENPPPAAWVEQFLSLSKAKSAAYAAGEVEKGRLEAGRSMKSDHRDIMTQMVKDDMRYWKNGAGATA